MRNPWLRRTFSLCLIILVYFNLSVRAQSGNPNPNPSLTNLIPPSPNAASLGKFGDIPVGYFTGVPQVNVPIYSYKNADNGLNLSISLDYHAGGIKVDELASNTGIGWALSAGGVITRTRRGIADEDAYGGFMNTAILPNESEGNKYPVSKYMEINSGVWDSQTDIFNFNVGGKNGKFMFGKNNDFLMLTPNKIKVQSEIELDGSRTHFKRFTIIDENGTKYIFDSLEKTSVGNAYYDNYISSWFLSKIIAPFATDSILIEYEAEYYGYAIGKSGTITRMLDQNIGDPPPAGGLYGSIINGKRVKKISFPDSTKVTFTYDNVARTDVGTYNNPGNLYRLKQITISNGTAVRGYNLYHDYSTNRLTLKNVIPYNAGGEDKGYAFEYYTSLPNRLTNFQDHWGFYNNNPTEDLFPHEYKQINGTTYSEFAGGNRETDVERVKAGSLTKIIYPTGGYTQFEMEANKAYDSRLKKDIITNIQIQFPNSRSVHCSNTQAGSEGFTFEGDLNSTTPVTVSFYTGGNPSSTNLIVQLKNSSNQVVNTQSIPFSDPMSVTHSFSIYNLAAGNYTWNVSVQGADYFDDYIQIEWTEQRTQNPDTTIVHIDNPYIGGLRIKSIKNYDGINSLPSSIREYEYLLEDGVTSSGALGTYPEYTYGIYYDTRIACGPIVDMGDYRVYFNNGGVPNAIIRATSPVQTLALTNGSPVNYTRVVEKFTNNGQSNGKIVRYFTSYGTNGVPAQHNYPYAPPDYYDWSYGQLTKELVYDKNNNLLKKTINDYVETQDIYYNTPGRLDNFTSLSLAPVEFRWQDNSCDGDPGNELASFTWSQVIGPTYFLNTPFTPVSGRKDLIKTRTVEFNGADSLVNEVTYTYDTAFNINKTLAKNSRNEQIEEIIHYPYEYTTNTVANAMKSKNMYAPPIATEKWKTVGGNKYLAGGMVNQYQQLTSGIRKATIESFESSSPVATGNVPAFNPGSFNRAPSLFKEAITFNQYNSKGFITQQAKSNDVPQSIIWDHNQQLPIAQVINSTVGQTAYTSFEADGLGGWMMNGGSSILNYGGLTGNKTITGGVNKTVPAGNYVVGVWSGANTWINGQSQTQSPTKIIGPWRYFEVVLTNVTSINVAGDNIDEVRLYPVGAQMTTYTYDPLIGVTSQCDANNRITYYEYDGFGRLKVIRDENKNVLKTFDYQYQKNYNQ